MLPIVALFVSLRDQEKRMMSPGLCLFYSEQSLLSCLVGAQISVTGSSDKKLIAVARRRTQALKQLENPGRGEKSDDLDFKITRRSIQEAQQKDGSEGFLNTREHVWSDMRVTKCVGHQGKGHKGQAGRHGVGECGRAARKARFQNRTACLILESGFGF